MSSPNTHWVAAMAFERLVYSLTGGIVLGVVVWLLLRLLPGKNSRTRFAVWFSTLLAVALMPLISVHPSWQPSIFGRIAPPRHAVLAIPASWAEYIVLAWAVFVCFGLARVAAGMWQLKRLRRRCVPIDRELLSGASQARISEAGSGRTISILVSSDVEVPTAVGFLHPAIVIPMWLADESAATELEYVLLHELAHLQRWDDWSNLVQKLIKSVFFFHPAVWWIEHKLSLDREMACDDEVLAQSVSPRMYAECLARVAEKRFLRRQIALAQAAVDRMKQLSRRVARILDANRTHSVRLWKPAVPMVLGVAVVCAVSALQTNEFVRLTEPVPARVESASSNLQIPLARTGGVDPVLNTSANAVAGVPKTVPAVASEKTQARAWPASFKTDENRHALVPATHKIRRDKPAPALRARHVGEPESQNPFVLSKFVPEIAPGSDGAPSGAIVLVVASQRIISTGSGTWQFNTWELRVILPANHPVKPIPRKT